MSTVDNRIVRMQFDNAQFEAGVMRSMKTLDALNEKLQFKEASKGLSALMVAVEGVSSKSISNAVNALDKISSYSTKVLGMMAQKVKTQFADKIVSAIEAIPQRAMSQIKSGGWNRAMNIANAKFQIEGLKYSWDAVREAADYAVTDTAYGLDSAAKAASQLAASGVDFEKVIGKDGAGKEVTQMHKSLRAISGVAAMTNASYDDIAHTFTRIAGQGRVMGEDLNSLASRGLNAAATLAKSLNVTESEVRDMVSKGAIDFQMFSEAMDEAYGDHAKEANKTFTGSLSNMKAALSRIGAIFTQPVIDKTNTFFVAVTSRIKEFQKALNDTTDADGKKTLRFASHFAEAWESGVNAASKFVEALNLDWFQNIGSALDNMAIKAKTVFDGVNQWFDKSKKAAEKLETIGTMAKMTVEDLAVVEKIIAGEYGNGAIQFKKLQDEGLDYKRLQGYVDEAAKVGYNLKQLGWTVEDLNKETEEAVKNGTEAELKADRISTTLGNLFNALKYGRDAIVSLGSTVKTFSSTIFSSISNSAATFVVLSHRIATLSHAFSDFAKALQPTDSVLSTISGAVGTVTKDLDSLTDSIFSTTTAILKFAAEALRSEKMLEELAASDKLTPLQESVLSVMRVIKNLGRAVGNVASFIYKIVRAIVRGIGKAFNPSGVLSGVADFSEGLANLTEKFKVTDEAASAIETVFESIGKVIFGVANAISKAVGSITKFITSIGKAKTPTTQVSNTLSEVKETGEKTNSIFDTLKTTFEKFAKKLKELPDKFNELKDAVNQQEGVIRLKESFATLKQNIKDTIEKMKPFKKDVEEVGEAAGGTGEIAIGKLASGIGIVAGKFADFIDKLPGWGTKIENFWNNLKTTVETWTSNIHLDKFFDNLGDGVTQFFESDDSIIGKIKTFAGKVFDGITGALEDVDWGKVGKGGILTLVAMNLFNFFKIGSGIETTIKGFASIPKNIGKIFTELGTVFRTANKSLKHITNAYIFSSIVSSLMLMVSAVIILGGMDQNELKQGIAGVIWLSVGMAIIGKAVGAILGTGDRYFNKQKIKEIDKSEKNLLQINNKLGGFIGAGIMLAGLGVAIWLMSKALIDLGKEYKKNGEAMKSALWGLIQIALVLIGAFAVIGIIATATNKQNNDKILGPLFGAGLLLAGLGVAMYLFTQVFKTLATDLEGIDQNRIYAAFGMTVVIMLLMSAFVFAAGKALEKADWKSLAMMTVTMVVAVLMVGLIAAEMVGLAYLLEKFQDSIPAGTVMAALGIMASIMLSIGLMVYLMGRGLADVDHPGALLGLVFMMGLLIAGIAAAITIMTKSLTKNNVAKETIVASVLGMIGIILAVGAVTFAIAALTNNRFQGVDRVRDTLLSIGAVFVLVGVMALLVAIAVEKIAGADIGSIIVVLAFVSVVLAVVTAISKMAAKRRGVGEEIGEALFGVALAFVGIAAAVLIMAAAMKVLSTITFNGALVGAIIGIVVALGAFIGIGYLLAKAHLDEEFNNVAMAMLKMGFTFLAAGAGIWLAAKGIELMVSLAAGIISMIRGVAEALAEHPVIFLGVLAGLALLVWFIQSIMKNIGPIIDTVIQAVNTVVNFVSAGFERLTNNLKTGGTKVSKWWGDLQPKLKIGIVTGIATLCAAILQASPEMLKTIKELIKKVIFFLVDIIPTVVDGLFTILLRLINSLADTIRKNSAKVAYAFWNVVESLVEVLVDVLVEGLLLLAKPIHGVLSFFGVDGKFEDLTDSLKASANGVKASMRQGLSAAKDYADSSEDITEQMSGLDAVMNKVTKDLKKDAIAYDNTSAGLAKMRGEAEAARVAQEKLGDSRGGLIDRLKEKFNLGDGINFDNFSTDQLQGMLNQQSLDIPDMEVGAQLDPNMDFSAMTDASAEAGWDGGTAYNSEYANAIAAPDNVKETRDATQDLMDAQQDQIASNYPNYVDVTKANIVAPINRTITGNAFQFFDNGKYISERVFSGMKAGADEFIGLLKKQYAMTGDEIWKALNSKDGIDAHSPSKKFYQSGLWCILGFQQAIKDNTYLATGQMENLGSSMVDAIGQPLDYVSKIASGDIEYDPRIRPVMDLSNIGRTAGDVSSMFANQNVTLSGITGQIAYDMTNLNGSNAAVVAEIQALREDMDYMTDELSNMQIVMDTGALVGSTVDAYDEAFGRRAVYGRRGN